ncbi:hypothetical protein CSA37_09735 [Candidatus Fermentibacteria bacterium]|nr:MAG: hypothetical protein CSA37_09735 [Candidatus Fermentibacteria bacterium]
MKTAFAVALILTVQPLLGAVDVENPFCRSLTLEGYLDLRYSRNGSYNAVPSREFQIRRSGLEVAAEVTDNLEAELKVELQPDEVFLKNALVQWSPLDFASARFGQFKRETVLGGTLSTWNLPLFERPLSCNLMEDLTYSGRDIGMDIEVNLRPVESLILTGTAGVFNGDERAEERENNELLYSFRGVAEAVPLNLKLGGSVILHRLGAVNSQSVEGYISSSRLMAFSADIQFNHSFSNWYDIQILGEYTIGDNWEWVDALAGEDPPFFKGLWSAVTFSWHPWNIDAIRTISLSAGYDRLQENLDLDNMKNQQISLICSVYPTENTRIRFGRVIHIEQNPLQEENEYTDIIMEAGLRF